MQKKIKSRVLKISEDIIKSNKTIRELAKDFNVSKSTVHKDLKERIMIIDKFLGKQIKIILQQHLAIRHIKGGEATRKKYVA